VTTLERLSGTGHESVTRSPEETQGLGARIGELAAPGDIYLLSGPLGAGKTCFTQGIAQGLSVIEPVVSPSFVLVRELHGRLPLYHIDLYRLDDIEEIVELGLDEYLYGNGVCVIEWAEKGFGALPAEHLLFQIGYISENEQRPPLPGNGQPAEKERLEYDATGNRHFNRYGQRCPGQ
jgi:tRNA threonylcarbamoyladenosine biosynthesis protein TsaE